MKKSTFKFLAIAMFFMMGISVMAQQYDITFQVDMTNAANFNSATDNVWMSGNFAGATGWAEPGTDSTYMLAPLDVGSMLYALTATIDSGEVQYKYFKSNGDTIGWANGEWDGDPNRKIYITDNATVENVWMNKPTVIIFTVNMTDADPFDPTTDDVYISGNFVSPDWTEPGTFAPFKMNPVEDSAMYYRLSYTLYDGSYEFKYFRVINNEHSWSYGEWDAGDNRTLTVDTTTIAKINDVWGDINAGIFNDPNIFTYNMYPNPVLTVLTIGNASDVNQVNVYDVTGKLVRSMQSQSVQKVTIDVTDLQAGVYIINVSNDKGIQTSKFVKN